MIGQGVARHLFALCVAAGGLGYESEFLNKYKDAKWQNVNGWELSTRYIFFNLLILNKGALN